jgi:hypothetical protein
MLLNPVRLLIWKLHMLSMIGIADEEGNSTRVDIEDRIVTHEKIKMEYVMGNFRDAIYKY